MPVCPPDISSFPTHALSPYPLSMSTTCSYRLSISSSVIPDPIGNPGVGRRAALLRTKTGPPRRISDLKFAPKFELFPIFSTKWVAFSLAVLYIMLKQFPSQARHDSADKRHFTPKTPFFDAKNATFGQVLSVCPWDGWSVQPMGSETFGTPRCPAACRLE